MPLFDEGVEAVKDVAPIASPDYSITEDASVSASLAMAATSATAQFDIFGTIANFFNPASNNINNSGNSNNDGPRGGGRGCAGGGNPSNYK